MPIAFIAPGFSNTIEELRCAGVLGSSAIQHGQLTSPGCECGSSNADGVRSRDMPPKDTEIETSIASFQQEKLQAGLDRRFS